MSAQGLRETADGAEKIVDRDELKDVQRRGRLAMRSTIVATFAATIPFVMLA